MGESTKAATQINFVLKALKIPKFIKLNHRGTHGEEEMLKEAQRQK